MRRLFFWLLLLITPAAAAQQPEQASLQFAPPMLWCLNNNPPDAGMIFLENYVDRPLPSPIYILDASVWIDGTTTAALLKGKIGNYAMAVDPQQQYGWPPNVQQGQPRYYKMFAYRRLESPENSVVYRSSLPVRYSAGDGVPISPECSGGDGTPLWMYVLLNIIAPKDANGNFIDLKNLPDPPNFYESRVPLTSVVTAGTGSSVRNIIPGPSVSTSKLRVEIFQQGGNSPIPYSQVQHISVCLRDGSTSNCQNAPVQLKFGSADNYYNNPGDRVWTNTINYAVPAGQDVLITVSSFLPGTGNSWSMNTTGGTGMYYSTTDAWNTLGMVSPMLYSGFRRSVSAAQMWN